jgi:hypothetical protein
MENRSASDTPATEALTMLSAFASVGARAFNLTLTDIEGEKIKYRPNTPLEQLRRTIGRILQDAEGFRHNVIIRPRSSTATLIQLDDLDFARAERLAPHSVIVFQTSPANYQAWVAVEPGAPPDFRRRLIKRIRCPDKNASGSTRIAGSRNFKTGYAPNFPRVEITHTNAGNTITMAALDHAGLVAAQEEIEERRPPRPALSSRRERYAGSGWRKWPSYEMCLNGAPKGASGKPKRSLADFTWCRTAIEWGWSVEATAGHLTEVSTKARENGEAYAMLTAQRAAESVECNPYRQKSTPRPA